MTVTTWRLLLLVVVLLVIFSFGMIYQGQGQLNSVSNNPFSKKIADGVNARYGSLAQSVSSNFTIVQPADLLAIICRETGSLVLQGKDSTTITGDNGNSIGIAQIDIKYHPEYTVAYLQDDRNNLTACATILDGDLSEADLNRQMAYGLYNGAGTDSAYATVAYSYYQYFSGAQNAQ